MQRRPAALAAVAAAVMLVLAVPVLHLRLGISDQGSDPASSTTRQAYDLLTDGFGPGFNAPLVLVAQPGSPAGAASLRALETRLPHVGDVASVRTIAAASGTEVIQVTPRTSPQAPATSALISALRGSTIPAAERGTALRVYVGGVTATYADFTAAVIAKLPWFLLTILGLSFLLLAGRVPQPGDPRDHRGDEPARRGGHVRGADRVLPVGLGNQRVRPGRGQPGRGVPARVHARDPVRPVHGLPGVPGQPDERGMGTQQDNGRAVRTGQAGTARVITAAATIMICVFAAFSLMGQLPVAEFGVGLAAAVALDAFILRTVLVPAVMHMFGNANWSLPGWLDRRLPHLAIEPREETPVIRPDGTADPDPMALMAR